MGKGVLCSINGAMLCPLKPSFFQKSHYSKRNKNLSDSGRLRSSMFLGHFNFFLFFHFFPKKFEKKERNRARINYLSGRQVQCNHRYLMSSVPHRYLLIDIYGENCSLDICACTAPVFHINSLSN